MRAGVSRMAPYRHFEDKNALLAAISDAGFVQFGDALLAARDAVGPQFPARLQAMALAYVKFAAEHPAHYEVMFSVAPKSDAGERAFSILEETIAEGQKSGEVRAGNADELARIVWSVVHGISTLRLDPGFPDFTLFASEIMSRGLLP